MVFQWFCYPLAVAIFFDQGLTIVIDGCSMVFPNSCTMATNDFGPFERPKYICLQSRQLWHIFWNAPDYREKGIKESSSSFQSFQALLQTEGIIKTLWTFRTTFCYHCKIQWFWEQWLGTTVELRVFFDGYGVRQPLVSIVFDGCLPLVRWWNVIFHRWGLFRDH